MAMMASSAPRVDQTVSAVQGGAASCMDVERRLPPSCERAEPRQRAMASRRGRRRPAERTHGWPWADVSGDATPSAVQHLGRRALWDPEAVRDALHADVIQPLRDANGVLVIDETRVLKQDPLPAAEITRLSVLVINETGVLKQGPPPAGVSRPYRGTVGRIEYGQIGVLLGDAGHLGQALLDRDLSRREVWINDRARARRAGMPEDRRVTTPPPLATQMRPRALVADVPATWGTGDRMDGDARWRRLWLEARPQASGLAVSGQEYVWREG